jgi:hypothetical protein
MPFSRINRSMRLQFTGRPSWRNCLAIRGTP